MKKNFTVMIAVILSLFTIVGLTHIAKADDLPWPSENPTDYSIIVDRAGDYGQYMEVNNQVAYCINLGRDAPSGSKERNPNDVIVDGTGENIADMDMMKKLLYYGYNGPGYDPQIHSGNSEVRYFLTAHNMHRAAHGEYKSGYKISGAENYWRAVAAKALPDWDFNLVRAAGEVTLIEDNDVEWQRSPEFYLEGGPPENSVNIPIEAPFQLRKVETGEVYTANSVVEIKVGEAFWIEAPKEYEGTLSIENLESTMPTKMRVIVLKWQPYNNRQRVVIAEYYKGVTSMSISFAGFLNCVELEKRDSANEDILISGAKFVLFKYDTDGTIYYYQRETKTWVLDKEEATVLETSENGKVSVEDLPKGDYFFEEIVAAPDYLLPEDENERIFPTTISDDGKVAKANVLNEKIPEPIDISIVKVDAMDYQQTLPGAELTLYMCVAKHGEFAEHTQLALGQEGGCWEKHQDAISGKGGQIWLEGLYSGSYLLIETKAPEGYQLPTEQWRIEVDTTTDTVVMYNQDGETPWNLVIDQTGKYLLLNEYPFQLPFTGQKDLRRMNIMGMALLIVGLTAYKKLKTKG